MKKKGVKRMKPQTAYVEERHDDVQARINRLARVEQIRARIVDLTEKMGKSGYVVIAAITGLHPHTLVQKMNARYPISAAELDDIEDVLKFLEKHPVEESAVHFKSHPLRIWGKGKK